MYPGEQRWEVGGFFLGGGEGQRSGAEVNVVWMDGWMGGKRNWKQGNLLFFLAQEAGCESDLAV